MRLLVWKSCGVGNRRTSRRADSARLRRSTNEVIISTLRERVFPARRLRSMPRNHGQPALSEPVDRGRGTTLVPPSRPGARSTRGTAPVAYNHLRDHWLYRRWPRLRCEAAASSTPPTIESVPSISPSSALGSRPAEESSRPASCAPIDVRTHPSKETRIRPCSLRCAVDRERRRVGLQDVEFGFERECEKPSSRSKSDDEIGDEARAQPECLPQRPATAAAPLRSAGATRRAPSRAGRSGARASLRTRAGSPDRASSSPRAAPRGR